jgi:hypothetical protein
MKTKSPLYFNILLFSLVMTKTNWKWNLEILFPVDQRWVPEKDRDIILHICNGLEVGLYDYMSRLGDGPPTFIIFYIVVFFIISNK